jgi:hypothetical protein
VKSIIFLWEYRVWLAVAILVRGKIPVLLWVVALCVGSRVALWKFFRGEVKFLGGERFGLETYIFLGIFRRLCIFFIKRIFSILL